jgi:hypothetical protein
MEVKFVIELQAGCAADNSCQVPYRWTGAPKRKGNNCQPSDAKDYAHKWRDKTHQLSFWTASPDHILRLLVCLRHP